MSKDNVIESLECVILRSVNYVTIGHLLCVITRPKASNNTIFYQEFMFMKTTFIIPYYLPPTQNQK